MMGELNVSYQIDTDNRENFPSSVAFNTFKKQRDLFYEILRIWEDNHLVPGWAFQIAVGAKIRTMLSLHNDAINYYHFARLFKSQLLISCVQNGRQTDIPDDGSLSFLKTLKHVNPKKLTQLQKRLVTPQPSKTQINEPSFPGMQEFFKDFILFAFNPSFYVHLENCLVHEIMELNDTQFNGSEIEDSETAVDEQTRQNFLTCLFSLRLLAKILALLVSLPYRSESNNSKDIVATQIDVRSRVSPSLNLHICLRNAITLGKLSLSLPWITKYLAMMDTVSLRLPYYKQLLELLYYMYKAVNHSEFSTFDNSISQQTVILLKSTLGWLFELPNMPKDFYLIWQETGKIKELRSLKQLDENYVEKILLLGEPVALTTSGKSNLDKLDIINDKVLRTCCPWMGPTISIGSANSNSKNHNLNKHITPVSSQLYKSGGSSGTKHLELQLEEAFFHGQPASTRKTVDFVSERVASTCVKHICNTMLTTARETNLNNFREVLKAHKDEKSETDNTEEPLNVADLKTLVASDMNALATNISKELKQQCESTIPAICEARVAKSIDSLLAEDSLSSVKQMCVKIATRLAMERIHQWIQSHIVGGSLFTKDMKLELNRFFKHNASPLHIAQEKPHNPDVVSPKSSIIEIRDLIWDMLDNSGRGLTEMSVLSALDNLYQTLTERADLTVGPEKVLYFLSMDLAFSLAAHRMDLFSVKIQEQFIKIWLMERWKELNPDSPIQRILSPRNVMLLAQPENNDIWPFFGKFIKKLLDKGVLNIDSLCDQCVALFRQDWPVHILKHLSKCLTEATTDFKASDETTEKVQYLLGWIAETYHAMEFYNEYSPVD